MHFSKLGLIFLILFLVVTIGMSIFVQFFYGDSQWMWVILGGGYPLSIYGGGILFFANTLLESVLGLIILFASLIFNGMILYFTGFGIEKLYKKYHS